MKIILRSAVMAALLIVAACGKDEANNIAEELEQQAEEFESRPLEANVVSDNVVIKGATKENGEPPTPNGAISLDVSNTTKTALLGEGFNISIDSDANVTGAYIRFKENDGDVSDSYYDVNVASNYSGKKAIKSDSKKHNKSSKSKEDSDVTLDVDFDANIEPGTFCYEICVYDAEGNISNPQEVCVTVESWGGNKDVVAKWSMSKIEDFYGMEIYTDVIGEKDCDDYQEYCSQTGMYVEVTECETYEYTYLNLNADGTFYIDQKGEDETLDEEAFEESCEPKYLKYDYRYESEGNWAYVAETKRLTLVEYKYKELFEGETEEDVNEAGQGELIFDGKAELDGNSLIIIETFGDETAKYYFTK